MSTSDEPATAAGQAAGPIVVVEGDIGKFAAIVIVPLSHHELQHYIVVVSYRLHHNAAVTNAIIQFIHAYRPQASFALLCAGVACLFGGDSPYN